VTPAPVARGRRAARAPRWALAAGLTALLGGVAAAAHAQQDGAGVELPPGARPGAAGPERDERDREPPTPAGPVLEIPPMIDRPLAPAEGPRVDVRRFELVGARDRPARGIRVADLRERLEAARAERPGGFTIGQLQQVADRVTRYYRERGLILAQAVVPVQTVEDGVVEIEVIEGRLGAVRPRGNELYERTTIEGAFSGLIGEPVTQADTESALLTLTDYPGLVAFGVFEPGDAVGEADLLVQVQSERRFDARVGVDNHGTRQTGRARARADLAWNNVTGNADRLRVTALGSFDPANSTYGALEYERLYGRRWEARAFLRSNRFDVGGDLEAFDISGETDQAGVAGARTWVRSRERNLSTELRLTLKRSRTLRAGEQDNEDRLTVFTLAAQYDSVDARRGGLNFAGIELHQGVNDWLGAMGDAESARDLPPGERPTRRGGEAFAEGRFTRLFGYYSRLQNLFPGQAALLRTEVQYTPDLLVPLEQYAIGGPNNVRAFPSSHALLDTAWLVSAEYVVDMDWLGAGGLFGQRWGDILRGSVFYDYGGGALNDPRPNEPDGSVTFQGIGAGLRLEVPGRLSARLQVAWEIAGDDQLADPDAVRDPQAWVSASYEF
jgi:hemolysin activation/secretion protein